MACSPNRNYLAVGDVYGKTMIYDFQTQQPIAHLNGLDIRNAPRCIQFSPDSLLVAIGQNDLGISLWNVSTGRLLNTFDGHRDDIQDLAFHPGGHLLASSDRGGIVRLWHVQDDVSHESFEHVIWPDVLHAHEDRVWSLDFSNDGSQLVTASRDCSFRVQRGRKRGLQTSLESPSQVRATFAENGTKLVVAGKDQLEVWDPDTNQRRSVGKFSTYAIGLIAGGDGRTAVSVHRDGTAKLWNLANSKRPSDVVELDADVFTNCVLSMFGDGQLGAVGLDDGIAFFQVRGQQFAPAPATLQHHEGGWLTPRGDLVITHQLNDLIAIDVQTGSIVRTFVGHENSPRSVAFSRDQRWMVSGGSDRTVRIWDFASGALLHTIRAHPQQIDTVDISPDGQTIVSGDLAGNLVFSHAATGRALFVLDHISKRICDVEFSLDGRHLKVVHDQGVVLLTIEPTRNTARQP